MLPDYCANCGEQALEERKIPLDIKQGSRTFKIQDRHIFCRSCKNISYVGSQISEHELAVAAALREADGLLSPDDLDKIRSQYKFRQVDMEQILSTGPKTWTRWERGKVPQNKAADSLIRLIAEDPHIAHRLMIRAGVVNEEAAAIFEHIEQEARHLARALAQRELGAFPSAEMQQVADRVADKAFDSARDVRRRAAL
jgi:putative zinc finger/helix-turn-helix YgiT family protein